jgi:hypothetical protein
MLASSVGTLNISHAAISTTHTDNTFNGNDRGYGGIVLNYMQAAGTLNISDSSIANTFTNNTVTGNT